MDRRWAATRQERFDDFVRAWSFSVQSIRPLTDDEIGGISKAFAPKVGKTSLEIKNQVNTDLLGGVKIRIGNRIFDGSLQGKLERLKRELIS